MLNHRWLAFVALGLLLLCNLETRCLAEIVTVDQISFVGTAVERFSNENNIINGTGLDAALTSEADFATVGHQSANTNRSWATTSPGKNGSDYFALSSDTIIFDLVLSETYSLNTFAIWGFHRNNTDGDHVSEMVINYSSDGGSTFDRSETIGIGLTTTNAFITSLEPTTANFLRLEFTDNHFGNASGGEAVGISEIRFAGAVVPESPAFVLFIVALTWVAMIRYRPKTGTSKRPIPAMQ